MASIAAERDRPALQESVGRYRLCNEVASGGMASVYLANAASNDAFSRLVAIKRIHTHLAKDPQFIEMFLAEARVASRISHPNVCAVFDFGQLDGSYFIAMEYLMGETFHAVTKRLHRNPAPGWFRYVAEIFAQAGEGLHAAHELRDDDGVSMDVVHRDVSPQNLFLTYAGCTKVVDFGVARCANATTHTEPGTIKGKFAYVAPEQVRCTQIDRRSDVWGLGVSLWEMLTGKRLFRGQTDLETLQGVLSAVIEPPSAIQESIPTELDAIVLRALSRDPADRFQTARDMSRALREFVLSQGGLLDQHDIAAWMDEILGDRHQQKLALVAAARETSVVRSRRDEHVSTEALASGEIERSSHAVVGPPDANASVAPSDPSVAPSDPSASVSPSDPSASVSPWGANQGSTASLASPSLASPLFVSANRSSNPSETREPVSQRQRYAMIILGAAAAAMLGVGLAYWNTRPEPTPAGNTAPAIIVLPTLAASTPAPAESESTVGVRATPPRAERTPAQRPPRTARVHRARSEASNHEHASLAADSADSAPDNEHNESEDAQELESEAVDSADESTVSPRRARRRWARRAASRRPRPVESAAAEPDEEEVAPEESESNESPQLLAAESPYESAPAPAPPPIAIIRRFPAPPPVSLTARAGVQDLNAAASSIPLSTIRRALNRVRSDFEQCYAQAARRAHGGAAGSVRVDLVVDEMGNAQRVRAHGHRLEGLADCVRRTSERIRTQMRPDTGRVSVSFSVQFTPSTQ